MESFFIILYIFLPLSEECVENDHVSFNNDGEVIYVYSIAFLEGDRVLSTVRVTVDVL